MRISKLAVATVFAVFTLLILTGAMPEPVPGANIYDTADRLTQSEEDILSSEIDAAQLRTGAQFIILTADDSMGMIPELYCDTFYDSGWLGENAFMLYINMMERDVYLATYGDMVDLFGDRDLDSILDVIAPSLTRGEDKSACSYFISACVSQVEYARSRPELYGSPVERRASIGFGTAALVSLGISLAVALILLMLHSRSLSAAPGIQSYFTGRGFRLTKSEDRFLNTNTTRVAIPQNNNGGGRGGGHGGGGARTTPGGGRAGGSGRKF